MCMCVCVGVKRVLGRRRALARRERLRGGALPAVTGGVGFCGQATGLPSLVLEAGMAGAPQMQPAVAIPANVALQQGVLVPAQAGVPATVLALPCQTSAADLANSAAANSASALHHCNGGSMSRQGSVSSHLNHLPSVASLGNVQQSVLCVASPAPSGSAGPHMVEGPLIPGGLQAPAGDSVSEGFREKAERLKQQAGSIRESGQPGVTIQATILEMKAQSLDAAADAETAYEKAMYHRDAEVRGLSCSGASWIMHHGRGPV